MEILFNLNAEATSSLNYKFVIDTHTHRYCQFAFSFIKCTADTCNVQLRMQTLDDMVATNQKTKEWTSKIRLDFKENSAPHNFNRLGGLRNKIKTPDGSSHIEQVDFEVMQYQFLHIVILCSDIAMLFVQSNGLLSRSVVSHA